VPRFSRRAELLAIAVVFMATTVGVYALGSALDEPLVSFAGLMVLASTFVPMPADAYVVQTAETIDPIQIAVVGGAVNALAVLGERQFLLRLVDFEMFAKLKRFLGTNKYLDVLDRHMFLGLAVAAASPLPFEVFRFVAVSRDVGVGLYGLATFVGRGSRFYVLAVAGSWFASQGLLTTVVGVLLVLFALGLVRSISNFRADQDQPQGTVD